MRRTELSETTKLSAKQELKISEAKPPLLQGACYGEFLLILWSFTKIIRFLALTFVEPIPEPL
jgi:hypothetical protein